MIIFRHSPTPDWSTHAKTKLLRRSQSTGGPSGQGAGSRERCWREAVARRTGGEKMPVLPIREQDAQLGPSALHQRAIQQPLPTAPLHTLPHPLA